MVDVDRFKEVNDAYGHQAGDQLLCEMAKRISGSVRITDTVARIGGDEFVVLLADLRRPEEAWLSAQKIVVAASVPVDIGSAQVTITASVGVCTYPEGGTDAETLIQNVDAAMYSAKEHGRNGFQVYVPDTEWILRS